MTRKHHHGKHSRRGLALKIGATMLVVLLVCIVAWKNETIHSRLAKTDKASVKANTSQSSTVTNSASERSSSKYGTYTVQEGDYLSTIATKYNTTVQALMELNALESSRVAAGETLKVPIKDQQQTSTRSAETE